MGRDSGDNLQLRVPEEALSQWDISEADKAAVADLPETVEPFFHADPQAEGQPMMRGGFYRLGNDLGMDIGIGARGVFAVDPEGEIPDRFVNSSVADLVEFLRETGAFQAGVAEMDEDEAADTVLIIRERLRQRDPAAFTDDGTWWSAVFEQLETGQI